MDLEIKIWWAGREDEDIFNYQSIINTNMKNIKYKIICFKHP